jgi:hypothetical protein
MQDSAYLLAMDSKLAKAAQGANILALLPGVYCAYGTYILLHSGVAQTAAQAHGGGSVDVPYSHPTILVLSFAAFLFLFSVGVVLNLINLFRKPNTAAVDQGEADDRFTKLANEDSADMSSRILLVEKSAELNVEPIEPYIDARFKIVNTSVFTITSEKVEGYAFYRGYSGEKCYLSRTPIISDPLNVCHLSHGKHGQLTLRLHVPREITDNIAAANDRLEVDFSEVRVYFKFNGIDGLTRFSWFGDVVEVGGLSVSHETLVKMGILPQRAIAASQIQTELKPIKYFVFVNVVSFRVDESTISRGKTLKIRYEITSSEDVPDDMWLGASLWDGNGKHFSNPRQDKAVSVMKGTREYDRDLTIPADKPIGNYNLQGGIWRGALGDSNNSVRLSHGGPVKIVVVA